LEKSVSGWYVIGMSKRRKTRPAGAKKANQNQASGRGAWDFYVALAERVRHQHGPVGVRLRNALAAVVEGGVIGPGGSLPSEREMAERLDVSRSTIRDVLKELSRQGLLMTRPGAGTVVVGRIPKALSSFSGFTEDMQVHGFAASSKVLDRSIAAAGADAAFRAGWPLGMPVMTLLRLRMAGGEALAYERVTVPVDVVGEEYDGSGSLYERMEHRNARPARMLQSLKAVEASAVIAELLGVQTGAAVFEISQLGYSDSGRVVEDNVGWYRGDRYKYVGEIRSTHG
jgi:GntR family transcriptional regulator